MFRTVVVLLAFATCALAQYSCPAPDLNGCSYANATDRRGMDTIVIFDYVYYDPPCIIVNVGQAVRFNGTFDDHPLQPGTANDTSVEASTDASSPFYISADTIVETGVTYEYTFTASGAFPYYCVVESHATQGMRGVVYVDTGCIAPPVAPVAPPVEPPVAAPVAPVAAPVAPVAAPKSNTPVKKSDAAQLIISAAAVVVGAALL